MRHAGTSRRSAAAEPAPRGSHALDTRRDTLRLKFWRAAATAPAATSGAWYTAPRRSSLRSESDAARLTAAVVLLSFVQGVILYVMLCGYPPFYAEKDRELYEQARAPAHTKRAVVLVDRH